MARSKTRAPRPGEGGSGAAGALLQPGLQAAEAAAHRLPDVRSARRSSGRRASLRRTGLGGKSPKGPAADPTPLLEALGITFDDELLTLSLTHRSYAYE